MTTARAYLLEALQRVIDGEDIDRAELDAGIANPSALAGYEKDAWVRLSHWADDAEVRKGDKRYAAFKRDGMRRCLAVLSVEGG